MDTLFVQIKERRFLSPLQQPYYVVLNPPLPPSPPFVASSAFNLNNKVNPSILLIIVILAIIFFISGLLHLLVRFLLRPQNRDPDEIDNVTALQGQLQQLFHLHDAGVDQSFIDALPVFNYKAIIGVKDPFDCAVCLCEFESEDKLRLLPKCSHAFHMECIDTWLLSHSTCPLCRASLLSDFPTNCSPIVLVLEAGSESSREIAASDVEDVEDSMRVLDLGHKSIENNVQTTKDQLDPKGERVVPIKLGKFKNVDGAGAGNEGSSDATPDARRCFSMGSFAYVMDESSSLQVPIRTATPLKKPSVKKPPLPLRPGHRLAMSECGCDSKREFEIQTCSPPSSVGRLPTKKESFSVSKIWLTGKKDSKANSAAMESSRRAFSFRFPIHRNNAPAGRRTASEINLSSNWDVESCDSLDSQPNAPSFARRTLLWLMGKPNKVVHSSSFSGNVV